MSARAAARAGVVVVVVQHADQRNDVGALRQRVGEEIAAE